MILLLLFFYILALIIEIPPLYKGRRIKEIIIYAAILTLALAECILDSLGIRVISPQEHIKKIIFSILRIRSD